MSTYLPQPSREEFGRWVHDALTRLYDSPYLQGTPLAEALADADASAQIRSQNLRRILLNAIRALRPEAGVPAQSPDWRAYRILELRYIEGLSPAEVMQQLSFGRSQFFREQARMLDVLTSALWQHWQAHIEPPTLPEHDEAATQELLEARSRQQIAHDEVERLAAQATWESVDLNHLLEELHQVIDPLVRTTSVQVEYDLQQQIDIIRADRVILRQVVLTVLACALDTAGNGIVRIRTFAERRRFGLEIAATSDTHVSPINGDQRQGVGLEICRGFMKLMDGSLRIQQHSTTWSAEMNWQTTSEHTLLLIDDNAAFADLFRRYLVGQHWRVIHTADGATARQLLTESNPTVIVLDVMMPREDGWEVLIALRNNEATRALPVLICSVLNEPQMADALGANGYLTKPVNQAALMQALERVLENLPQEP